MEFANLLSQMPRTSADNTHARKILQDNPGYLPIAVLPAEGGKILWLDVQTHRFSEAKFRSALEALLRRDPPPVLLETNISLLQEENPLSDTLDPAGFIFFVHRCGSTLLAKALAQSPRNLVMHEADALHEGLWACLSDSWTQPITVTPE
ncbi:hypothetical protein HC928_23145, partial [bacterium]|nr:hypothetical protein [bacterium]